MLCDVCEDTLGVGGFEHRIVVHENRNLTHMCPDCWDEREPEDS